MSYHYSFLSYLEPKWYLSQWTLLLAGCESSVQITQLGMRLIDLFVVLVCRVILELLQIVNMRLQRRIVSLELHYFCCEASMTLRQVWHFAAMILMRKKNRPCKES